MKMGEDSASVHVVGCPRIDLVAEISERHRSGQANGQTAEFMAKEGVGGHVDLDKPFLLVNQRPGHHRELGAGERQINEALKALVELGMPTIMLWPNADAGSEDIARGMRKFRERFRHEHIRQVERKTAGFKMGAVRV